MRWATWFSRSAKLDPVGRSVLSFGRAWPRAVPRSKRIIIAPDSRSTHRCRRTAYDNSIKSARAGPRMLEALLVSTLVVAIGELGDKTQLLTLVLAGALRQALADHRRNLCRHARSIMPSRALDRALGARRGPGGSPALGARAVVLCGSRMGAEAGPLRRRRRAARLRPQRVSPSRPLRSFWRRSATRRKSPRSMLAAQFTSLFAVVAGTTLGMLLVDAPTAFIGNAAAKKIPFRAVRIVAAALFAALGVWVVIAATVRG